MLIFVKSNVTLSSWMLWSTLIFDGDGTPHSSACNDGGYGWILWSTLIFGGIGTPLLTQQLTWWFKVHLSCLSRKAHVSRAILISKLECWWTKFNVELSLIKLKSKIFTIALRTTNWTTKLNVDLCQVKCYTLKLNVVIYFDFWRGWNSTLKRLQRWRVWWKRSIWEKWEEDKRTN